MPVSLLMPQFGQGLAQKTAVTNDVHMMLCQPVGEIVFAAIVNAIWHKRGEFSGGMDRHHDHLSVRLEGP